jgi:6-phosphofructokinase 1
LCSVFGAYAIELVAANDFGKMVAYLGNRVDAIPISEAVGRLKTVNPTGSLASTARALGICLGD